MSNTIILGESVSEQQREGAATMSLNPKNPVRWSERIARSGAGFFGKAVAKEASIAPPSPQATESTFHHISIPRIRKPSPGSKGNYILLKKYSGFVSTRGNQSFTAQLYESSTDYPVVEAEFELEELSPADRELAVAGAALVWTIGYHEEDSRRCESLIYMRRRPGWSTKLDSEKFSS
jgi:hypothetical protein